MIKILEDASGLADIFKKEFDSVVPTGNQGNVIAVIEDGEIKAFITAEVLIRVGLLWIKPEYRKSAQGNKWMRQLIRFLFAYMPKEFPAITIDDTGRYGKLFTKLGMRKVLGTIYRLD